MISVDLSEIEDVYVCKCGVVLDITKCTKVVEPATSYSDEWREGKCPVCGKVIKVSRK